MNKPISEAPRTIVQNRRRAWWGYRREGEPIVTVAINGVRSELAIFSMTGRRRWQQMLLLV